MAKNFSTPASVGVLGGGRMGAGIAHAFLVSGAAVTVIERDQQAADAARERIERSVEKSLQRATISGSTAVWMEQLVVSVNQVDFSSCDLVVEALPENLDLKVSSLKSVESYLGDNAWLASNTSSLSIDAIASELSRPERFCGMHFFNPVPASELVEIVNGEETSNEMKEQTIQWVSGIGKTPVVVNDAPGFASSRLGVALGLEAVRMVEEGVAEPDDIDNAMVLGYKHPVGPLALTDIVGLDVRLGIAEYLESMLGDRFTPPQLLRDKVARGEVGRKVGKGFYSYE